MSTVSAAMMGSGMLLENVSRLFPLSMFNHVLDDSIDDDDDDAICRFRIRTLVVKFMEMVVMSQTFPDAHSPAKDEDEVSLDDASTHVAQFIKLSHLEDQAKKTLERLLAFHGTQHISSVNLMACTQTLVIIARSRYEVYS